VRRSFLRGLALTAGGSGAVALVALVRNVLIARVMGPSAFGFWQACLVVLRLAGESHLGALHAVAMDAPVHRGAGREAEARDLERRGLAVALLLSLAVGVVAGAVLRLRSGPGLLPLAVLLAATVVAHQWFLADALLLRTRRQFGRQALLLCLFAAVHLVGLLLLLPGRLVSGALLAWILGIAASLLLVRAFTKDPLPLPSAPVRADLLALVRRGLPAYLVGLTFVVLLQVDRVVIGSFLGREALGYFGILTVGGSVVLFLPDAVAGVLWPFAGEHYGRHGEEAASLRPVAVATLRGLALLLGAVLALALLGTEILVGTDLVDRRLRVFAPALDALRWYLPGVFFLSLAHPLRFLLITAGAEHAVLRLQVGVLALTAVAEIIAALSDGTLRGVAMAGTACGAAFFLLVLRQAAATLALGRTAWLLAAEAAAVLGAAFLVVAAVHRYGPDPGTMAGALGRLAVPAALALLVGIAVLRSRPPSPAAGPDGEA